jgi:predicted nucleic acid-binding Zn ribbon protein
MAWHYVERACSVCGTELPEGTRRDAVTCSDRCRQALRRSRRASLAAELITYLSPDYWDNRGADARLPGRDAIAASAMYTEALDGQLERANLAAGRPRWLGTVAQVRERAQHLWQEFGEAVVRAAAIELPTGACRWHQAIMWTATHGGPKIADDPANHKLLGRPCDACAAALTAAATPQTGAAAASPSAHSAAAPPRPPRLGATKADRIDTLMSGLTHIDPDAYARLVTRATGPELQAAAEMARKVFGTRRLPRGVRDNYEHLCTAAWRRNHK